MEEIKKLTGYLKGFGERKRGKKEDGTEWILWEYKIEAEGKVKVFTGFDDSGKEMLGQNVDIEYKQVPREVGDGYYNNLFSILPAGAVEEADKKYHVTRSTDMSSKQKETEDQKKGIQSENYSNNPAFFGMVWNKTIDWIISERNLKQGTNQEYLLDPNFDSVFNHLWEKATAKRKEKLGY